MIGILLASDLNQLVWEFLLSGGVFMLLIVLCSLVAAAIVIHRLLSLRRGAVTPRGLLNKLRDTPHPVRQAEMEVLRAEAIESESTLGEIACAALSDDCADAEEAMKTTEAVAREEVLKLQSGLSILEDVITIAPLLGLLGTVSGLVAVFAELGIADSADPDPKVLAEGIARALNTTIAGLAVAVPAVVARTYFHKKIEVMAVRMEILFARLIHDRFRKAADRTPEPAAQDSEPEAAASASPSMEKYQSPPPVEEAPVREERIIAPPPASPATLDDLPVAAPQPQPQPEVREPNAPPPGPASGARIVSRPIPIPPGSGNAQQGSSEGAAE